MNHLNLQEPIHTYVHTRVHGSPLQWNWSIRAPSTGLVSGACSSATGSRNYPSTAFPHNPDGRTWPSRLASGREPPYCKVAPPSLHHVRRISS